MMEMGAGQRPIKPCQEPAGSLPVSPGLRRCRPVLLMRSLGIGHVLYGGPGYWAVQGVATCSLSGLCGLTDDACAGQLLCNRSVEERNVDYRFRSPPLARAVRTPSPRAPAMHHTLSLYS